MFLRGLRLGGLGAAVWAVEGNYTAVRQGGGDRVRILRIGAAVDSLAALRDEAIGIRYAACVLSARRAAKAVVVLRTAVDVVERLRVIHGNVIELRDRQIGFENPVLALVETLVHDAVAAHQIAIVVLGIDPDLVIVHVLAAAGKRRQRAAAVV